MSPYGLVLGAGLKLIENKTESYLSFSFLTSFTDYTDFSFGLRWNRPEEWFFRIYGTFGDNIQDYYGEGDQTPNLYQTLKSTLDQGTCLFQVQLEKGFYLGPSFQYLYRGWTSSSLFPNESEWKAGVQASFDDRVPSVQPVMGRYLRIGLFTLPADVDDGIGTDVFQWEGEGRLYEMVLDPICLVSKVRVGFTSGDPSYSFRYSLGGEWQLRGYNSNRFRGNNFWLVQEEARFPLFPYMGGALSVDMGDITDSAFNNLLGSVQVGLRSTPLPYFGAIVRLDWGFGSDDNELWFDIGEPF